MALLAKAVRCREPKSLRFDLLKLQVMGYGGAVVKMLWTAGASGGVLEVRFAVDEADATFVFCRYCSYFEDSPPLGSEAEDDGAVLQLLALNERAHPPKRLPNLATLRQYRSPPQPGL
jgi:hypothetical protein